MTNERNPQVGDTITVIAGRFKRDGGEVIVARDGHVTYLSDLRGYRRTAAYENVVIEDLADHDV